MYEIQTQVATLSVTSFDQHLSDDAILDMLIKVHEQLSYRLSLDNLARATLGAAKGADGLQALQWWKEGKLAEIDREEPFDDQAEGKYLAFMGMT